MIDLQFKAASVVAVTASSGAAAIVNESTLIPLGIFCMGIVLVTGAAWRISASVTRATDRLVRIEERLDCLESQKST